MYKLTTFVPKSHAEAVRAALARGGAGSIGCYDCGSFSSTGITRFRPLEGANPAEGEIGKISEVEEERIETEVLVGKAAGVIRELVAAHPYEAPAIHVVPLIDYRLFLTPTVDTIPGPSSGTAAQAPVPLRSNPAISVSLDGCSATYRGEVARLLATAIGAELLTSPPEPLLAFKDWFAEQQVGDEAVSGAVLHALQLMGTFLLGADMQRRTGDGGGVPVVMDGYFVSGVASTLVSRRLNPLPPLTEGATTTPLPATAAAAALAQIAWPRDLPRPSVMLLLTPPPHHSPDASDTDAAVTAGVAGTLVGAGEAVEGEDNADEQARNSQICRDVGRRLGCVEVCLEGGDGPAVAVARILEVLQAELPHLHLSSPTHSLAT